MADNQSVPASTVAPSDSVSTKGRRSRPGKAERQAKRSAVGSQPGHAASAAKAFTFASGVQTPKPQPGKFPVVFQTGAGEPARDKNFVMDPETIHDVLSDFPDRYTHNAKYNEFHSYAELEDTDFSKEIVTSALLRLSQQVVHSHVNMGLPQGDFAPIASTDVRVPASIAAFISQFGEFSVPALGTRFLLSDYENTVRALIWAASQVSGDTSLYAPILRSWLPVRPGDRRTKTIVAERLNRVLTPHGLHIEPKLLEAAVLSGDVPDVWENIKPVLGPPPEEGKTDKRDRFDFLFKSVRDAANFVVTWTAKPAAEVLDELGLPWPNPRSGHVDWGFNAKEIFTSLSDAWARKVTTYAQFFEMSSSQLNRTAASGSQSQMAVVSTTDAITVIKTHLALTAPEFSLAACFPATAIFSGPIDRKVVLTTPLSVSQRATEFVQMDWR